MAVQTFGQTDNFTIRYQDNFSHAVTRAQALQRTVEQDFSKLASWFNINAGFGQTNRIIVLIDDASLAKNNGYHSDGTSEIRITPFNDKPDNAMSANAVRALFVAEFVEVLMSYNNTQAHAGSWNPAGSDGEGLSRVCAALFYPDAYYNPDYLTGPFVNRWLGSLNRADWISNTEPTDTDSDSFGCAILFLYFLHFQLGKPMQSIIAAGGGSLELTYQNLTGSNGGYTAMLQLLSPVFPAGSWPNLATDNPFPILSGEDRQVNIYTTQEPSGAEFVGSAGTASVSPYTNCPEKIYGYKVWDTPMLMRITAAARGFGRPKFTWKVNGHSVVFGGTISDSTTVYVDDPSNPSKRKKLIANFSVQCQDYGDTSTWMSMQHEIRLYSASYSGHIPLLIEAEVSEQAKVGGSITGSNISLLDTQRLAYDPPFDLDRTRCRAAWAILTKHLVEIVHLPLWTTLPDPPPNIIETAETLETLIDQLESVRTNYPEKANEIIDGLARTLRVSPQFLRGSNKK